MFNAQMDNGDNISVDLTKEPIAKEKTNEEAKETSIKSETGKGKRRSVVWDHFERLPIEKGKKAKAVCLHCGAEYACDSRLNGTKSMLTHLESTCKGIKKKQDPKQTLLGFKPKKDNQEGETLGIVNFTVEAARKALAEMIIIDELPFRFVEGEGFKRLMRVVQPRWIKLPCRTTVARDCVALYMNEKKNLKKALKGQRVCLTTDTWTSIQNLNYMCLTAHYIDNDWKLQKKILNFCVVPNHKGETLGKVIELCLLQWGIDKFLTITVDNASSNNLLISFMRRKTKNRKATILDHDFLHVRCSAHILNLVVCEGLKEIEESIVRVRNIVRYVRSSPSRLDSFKECAKKEGISCDSQPCLDVATRWNSTYFMLERALQFQKAFERLADEDNYFLLNIREDEVGDDGRHDVVEDEVGDVDAFLLEHDIGREKEKGKEKGKGRKKTYGPPLHSDWTMARLYVKFLKLFYNATLRFSGSLYVTSNSFFMEIMLIHSAIKKLSSNGDELLKLLANGMSLKFDKYWGKLEKVNVLLLVAVILDPRYKFKYVEWWLTNIYGPKHSEDLLKTIKKELMRLYDWYVSNYKCENVQTSNLGDSSKGMDVDEDELDLREKMKSQFKMHLEEENSMVSKSELERYLAERSEEDNDKINILSWWKTNSTRFPILSQVARDVLAIPVSTVASESAFSTGGRVLDPFRSSLGPTTVEALICTQNWLRSASINLREQMDEVEGLEEVFTETSSDKDSTLID